MPTGQVGVFIRNEFHFLDGDNLVIDSAKKVSGLRKALQAGAMN